MKIISRIILASLLSLMASSAFAKAQVINFKTDVEFIYVDGKCVGHYDHHSEMSVIGCNI